jgi:hypothetical protein
VGLGAKMKIGFCVSRWAFLVNDVTGIASHIERGVPTPFCGGLHPFVVTSEAKVLLLASSEGFTQMIFIGGIMGIMTNGAIPSHWRMHQSLSRSGFLVSMTLQAESENRRRGKLYARDVARDAHFMTRKTATFDGCMDGFFFGLVLVAAKTLGPVNILGKRSRMLGRKSDRGAIYGEQKDNRQISYPWYPQKPADFSSKISCLHFKTHT